MARAPSPGQHESEHCDIVVAGGGSAGVAMAARLAESGLSVLLLEAGKTDRDIRLLVPALTIAAVRHPAFDWNYPAEPDPSIGGRADTWPAGKRLGGGSSINGMIYVRGHRSDYDHWRDLGADGWGADDVLPYFKRMETTERQGETRGHDGPLGVAENSVRYPIVDAFLAAAQNQGIPRNPDHNGDNPGEGVDYAQATQRDGMRCSTARGYLRSGARRPTLTVVLEALVDRVLIEDGRATGVEYRQGGKMHRVRARHGIVVSAGSIGSPLILMRSGIGPAADLSEQGIAVVQDLPGVGRNLQEHVGVHLIAKVDTATLNSDARGISALREGAKYLFRRQGAIATSMCHAQAFVRSRKDVPVPDVQISLTAFAFDINDKGRAGLLRDPSISLTICLARPQSRGAVRLRSKEASAPPIIQHQLLGVEEDVEKLARGVEIGRGILSDPAISPLIAGIVRPVPAISGNSLRDYVRAGALPLFHPIGTCRIGKDADAVVDPDLRVNGIDGLWVCDASVMPTMPIGNTNATAIMIGEKGSDHVLREIRGGLRKVDPTSVRANP